MIDLDGKVAYSKTVMVSINATLSFSILPNPAKTHVLISVNNKNPILAQIVDMNGRIVKQENLPENSSPHNLNIDHLTKGLYLIRLVSAHETHLEKLIVR